MKIADKFGVPILSVVDTPGAYPGIEAEARGQASAIACSLREMSRLRVPILVICIGEGGSGGAMGIGVGDRVAMMQYAYYSVISPEGCAAILGGNGEDAPTTASALRLTSADAVGLAFVDDIIPEPLGGAHRDPARAARHLREYAYRTFDMLCRYETSELLKRRYARLRSFGSQSRQ